MIAHETAVGCTAPCFRFTYRGETVEGSVMGAGGGMVTYADDVERACRRHRVGRPHGLFEPSPGKVAVFPDYCAERDGVPVLVPISGYAGEVGGAP